MYKILSLANRLFYFSFSIWTSFISFSHLIALARTASSMLNGRCEYLFPDLRGKTYSL